MPDARYYVSQAKVLLSASTGVVDPALSIRLRGVAEDYLAKALKLKMDPRLRVNSPPLSPTQPDPQVANVGLIRLTAARPSPDTVASSLSPPTPDQ
jgi:hypothetical protein